MENGGGIGPFGRLRSSGVGDHYVKRKKVGLGEQAEWRIRDCVCMPMRTCWWPVNCEWICRSEWIFGV